MINGKGKLSPANIIIELCAREQYSCSTNAVVRIRFLEIALEYLFWATTNNKATSTEMNAICYIIRKYLEELYEKQLDKLGLLNVLQIIQKVKQDGIFL